MFLESVGIKTNIIHKNIHIFIYKFKLDNMVAVIRQQVAIKSLENYFLLLIWSTLVL